MQLTGIEKTLGILGFIPGVSTLTGLIGAFIYRTRYWKRVLRLEDGYVPPDRIVGRRLSRVCERRIARAERRLAWASLVQLVPLFNVFAAIYAWVELGNLSLYRGVRDSKPLGEVFAFLCQKYKVRPFSGPSAGTQNELLEQSLMKLHETELQNLHLQKQLEHGVFVAFPVQKKVRCDAAVSAQTMIQRLEPKEARSTKVDAIMERAFKGALRQQILEMDRSSTWLSRPPPAAEGGAEEVEQWLKKTQQRCLQLEHLVDTVVPQLQHLAGDADEDLSLHVARAREALQLAKQQEARVRELAA